MPSFTTVIEDTSPILIYSEGDWKPGSSNGDPFLDQYSESSFTLTETPGASVVLGLQGVASIAIFGAKRPNHGNYIVKIDNSSSATSNGQASPEQFNQLMFSSNLSSPGLHDLTVINVDDDFDVDYVTIGTKTGQDDEDLIVNTFQDTHPAFTYSPPSVWTTPTDIGAFVGGSARATTVSGATANFTFYVSRRRLSCQPEASSTSCYAHTQLDIIDGDLSLDSGDAVALYGPVGPNCAIRYSVQVDDGSQAFFSANKQSYRRQQMLFFAGNLGTGQHSLLIQPVGSAGELAIDYANVYTTESLGGSFIGMAAPTACVKAFTTAAIADKSHISSGVIASLVLLAALAMASSLLSVFLLWRQRHTFGFRNAPKPSLIAEQGPNFVQPFPKETIQQNVHDFQGVDSDSVPGFPPPRSLPSRRVSGSTSLATAPPQYQLITKRP